MTYKNAQILLGLQERNIKKVNDLRIKRNGYEYRITYKGGFSSYVAIDRREIGKRNFKYFGGVGAYGCRSAAEVLKMVIDEINKKASN